MLGTPRGINGDLRFPVLPFFYLVTPADNVVWELVSELRRRPSGKAMWRRETFNLKYSVQAPPTTVKDNLPTATWSTSHSFPRTGAKSRGDGRLNLPGDSLSSHICWLSSHSSGRPSGIIKAPLSTWRGVAPQYRMKIPDHQTSTFFRRDGGLQEDTELTFISPVYAQSLSTLVVRYYRDRNNRLPQHF